MRNGASKIALGMWRIAEQWPFLRYLGMGAWWAWIWTCYNGAGVFSFWPMGPLAERVGLMYLFSTPAIAGALILAACMWRRATALLERRGLVVLVAALATVGTLLISFSPWLGGDAAFMAGAVLTGLGTSVLCLKTGETYGSLGRHEVLTAGTFSLVFASFLFFMATGLPPEWQPFLVAALPLASAALFIMPGEDPFPADPAYARPLARSVPGARSYVNLVLASVMVAGTAGFGKGLAASSMTLSDFAQTGAVMTFVIAVASLVICVVVNGGDIVKAVRRIYAALIMLGVGVVLVSQFGLSLVYMNVGKELLWMMLTCLMAYTAFRFGFSPVRAFGFGQAAYLVSSTIFWWAGMICAPLLDQQPVRLAVTLVMVLAIVGVFAFVFTEADIKFLLTWRGDAEAQAAETTAEKAAEKAAENTPENAPENAPETPGAAARTAPGRVDVSGASSACAAPRSGAGLPGASRPPVAADVSDAPSRPTDGGTGGGASAQDAILGAFDQSVPAVARAEKPLLPVEVARRYGLSDRELEVLALFAQGRSANWIAEALTISNNTVRSHLRSSYAKLDVHTRQELIDFVGAHQG